jgi:hypothetical protein
MMVTTNNKDWGFFGTIAHHADAAEAWPLAMTAIMSATEFSEEAVRDFLDSRHGQHFADDVGNGLVDGLTLSSAVEAAVGRWMNWETDRAAEQNAAPGAARPSVRRPGSAIRRIRSRGASRARDSVERALDAARSRLFRLLANKD